MKLFCKVFIILPIILSLTTNFNRLEPIQAESTSLFIRESIKGVTDIIRGTNGIAIADINKDGWMDILITSSPPRTKSSKEPDKIQLFLNHGNMIFSEQDCYVLNQHHLLSDNQIKPQVPNLVDFNKDGFLDIFITRHRGGVNNTDAPGNSLYISQGDFNLFMDVSEKMMIQNITAYNRQTSIADINGDGWLDIAVGADNIGNPDLAGKPESRLYLFQPNGPNFEEGTFVDISNSSLAEGFGGDFTCDYEKDKGGGPDINLVDLDNDGDFDLIQSYHNDMLNTKPDNPCASAHFKFGVFVWKNLLKETGSFKLEQVTNNGLSEWGQLKYDFEKEKISLVQDAVRLPYLSFGDMNNDSFQDVFAIGPSFLSNEYSLQKTRGKLWVNEKHFTFRDITKESQLDSLSWTTKEWYEFQGWQKEYPKSLEDSRIYGADLVLGDFNNDGFLDFIACDRREPMKRKVKPRNVLYMNNGDSTFSPQNEAFSGIDTNSICAETADLNNDGLLDLYFAADPDNTGIGDSEERYKDKVFINTGFGTSQNNWLKLRLDGLSDAEIVGARVEFLDQEAFLNQTIKIIASRVVSSNHSYKSGSTMEVHAGLGKIEQVMVRVILPSGQEFTFGNTATNQYLSLNLTSKQVRVIYEKKEPTSGKQPNIVLILTDDLDETLGTMSYTPKLDRYIKQEGVTWEEFFVSDTLCCPSRATISRGQFVHNHGVLTNGLPGGGFDTFYARGNEDSTFANWLQDVGYETGFFGKYLNGYPFKDDPLHIPPGWSTWHSPSGGNPYSDFNYVMNENGKAVSYGSKPKDYLTDVIRDSSIDFMKQAKASNKPFMVYLSPYVPHSPATPAPRHEDLFPDLKTPRIRSFNEADISDKPTFFQDRKPLTERQIKEMDKFYRKRIQSMQAVDDMVEKVVLTLQELGELENTYIFFTSDNGFHMGQHRLPAGKGTAYEEDISVPLYVRGPGIPKGITISGFMGGNTDFAPTFADIAGAVEPPFVDGRSLLPILQGAKPNWRKVFFVEFYPFARGRGTKPETLRNVESVLEPLDMDEEMGLADNFSYIALRLSNAKYIEHQNGEKEYYDLIKDPYEMENAIKTLSTKEIKELSDWAKALHQAKGAELRKLEETPPGEEKTQTPAVLESINYQQIGELTRFYGVSLRKEGLTTVDNQAKHAWEIDTVKSLRISDIRFPAGSQSYLMSEGEGDALLAECQTALKCGNSRTHAPQFSKTHLNFPNTTRFSLGNEPPIHEDDFAPYDGYKNWVIDMLRYSDTSKTYFQTAQAVSIFNWDSLKPAQKAQQGPVWDTAVTAWANGGFNCKGIATTEKNRNVNEKTITTLRNHLKLYSTDFPKAKIWYTEWNTSKDPLATNENDYLQLGVAEMLLTCARLYYETNGQLEALHYHQGWNAQDKGNLVNLVSGNWAMGKAGEVYRDFAPLFYGRWGDFVSVNQDALLTLEAFITDDNRYAVAYVNKNNFDVTTSLGFLAPQRSYGVVYYNQVSSTKVGTLRNAKSVLDPLDIDDNHEEKHELPNSLSPKTGLIQGKIDLKGSSRSYFIFVPPTYQGDKPTPLVFVFHGGGGTASGVMWETRWNEIASKEGFICVYPEGTRKDSSKPANFRTNPQSWNDGSNRKTNEAMLQNVDDSNFIRQLIQLLQTTYNIDKNHIHATGFSNGASMSFRVGREVSDLFASIAPVSGSDWLENKPNELPLSLFYITGTKDPLNPMEGGEIFIGPISHGVKPPILEMLQKWVQKIEAPIVSETVSESDTLATVKYKPGVNGSEIIFTMVKNLGHYWPGGRYQLPEWILGSRENLDAINATKEIWDFFRSHPKNQPILIELWIGKNIATVNHQPYELEVAPMIKDGRTCVPVRFVSEALEASVLYDSKDQKITIQYQEITITLYINKKEALVEEISNGQKNTRTVYLEAPPFVMNGRTLVPVRFISEAFNLSVEWESIEQKITIESKQD